MTKFTFHRVYSISNRKLSYIKAGNSIGIHHILYMQIIRGYNARVTYQSSIVRIGRKARTIVNESVSGIVYGRTSRGDFILLDESKILFLSFETAAGPLTANIIRNMNICERIQTGDRIYIQKEGIFFPNYAWFLRFPPGDGWAAPVPHGNPTGWEEIQDRIRAAAESLLSARPPGKISGNLVEWLNLDRVNPAEQIYPINLKSFNQIWTDGAWHELKSIFTPLAGLGSGLTPSGDDLIMGFLLASARWGNTLNAEPIPAAFLSSLYELIDTRTTLLSRGLLRAAGEGEADERLIAALDYLVTGNPSLLIALEGLLSWGAHSGTDAFTGMSLYLSSVSPI